MGFYLGCSVWSCQEWIGGFYPRNARRNALLPHYGQRMGTVECNSSFYALPPVERIRGWAASVPESFRFCPKVSREVTHHGYLEPSLEAAGDFVERVQSFGDRLGVCFAQLPPHYGPSKMDDLVAFLSEWPTDRAPLALEVRHEGWFFEPTTRHLDSLLRSLGIGRACLDARAVHECPDDPQRGSKRRKPWLPVNKSVTAPFAFVRYVGHPTLSRNDAYLDEWTAWIDRQLRAGVDVYFTVHCPQERWSPTIARALHSRLEALGAVEPLPWGAAERPNAKKAA